MKKPLLYLLISLVVIIILVVVAKKAGWINNDIKIEVESEPVSLKNITETITANGKIQPKSEVKVSSDVSGEILELPISEGEIVKAGDILAKIQPDIYIRNKEKMEASVLSAEANLIQAQAQFKQSELSYNRNLKLWKEHTIADSEYEQVLTEFNTSKANVTASEASLRNARASLNEANDNLSKTTIYAPMSGTISKLNVEKGERVVGTAQFEGTEMMSVANLNAMEVVVDVNENDIVRVALNDTALIEVDAYPKKQFKGLVTQIANTANTEGTSTDQITNFEVKIFMLASSYAELIPENKPNYSPFRPGMSATVDIQTQTRYNTVAVPIQSVTMRKEEGDKEEDNDKKQEVVFILKGDSALQKTVEVGIQDDRYIEILSGIDTSDVVISGPYSAISRKLKQGSLVQPMKQK